MYNTKGCGYSLFLAEKYITDNCLILPGNRKFNTEVLKTIDRNNSQIFINKKIKYKLGCHVIKEEEGRSHQFLVEVKLAQLQSFLGRNLQT